MIGIESSRERQPLTWTQMLEAYRHAPKLKPIDTEDPAIIARVRHTMLPKEKLMSWFARTGIGRAEILAGLSRDEISRRVALAEQNRKNEPLPPPELFEPKRPPMHFAIDTFSE
jgi:hypothetical protein